MLFESSKFEPHKDPLGFLEKLAEMDMDEMMGMIRSTFGMMMDEETMMVVEEIMRSIDWEMMTGFLNGLTGLIR